MLVLIYKNNLDHLLIILYIHFSSPRILNDLNDLDLNDLNDLCF